MSDETDSAAGEVVPKKAFRESWKKWFVIIQDFVVANYLPIAFAIALTIALAWPAPGSAVVNVKVLGNVHIIQEINIGIVFFISGLALDTKALKAVKGSKLAVGYGFVSILLITPLVGFAIREIPLEPKEFTIGLVIFCIVPTTLGVGVALVRACKGNEAIALLLTVGTNILGVFVMPGMLKFIFLGCETSGLSLTIDIPDLLLKLVITILVPSVLGKVLRDLCKPAETFAKKYKTPLSLFSTTMLAMMIWQALSGAQSLLFQAQGRMIGAIIALSIFMYIFYLAINYTIVRLVLKVDPYEAVAIVITSSQKSAPVAITVISYITGSVSVQGLLATPCIVGQLAQIFLGSAMSPTIAARVSAYLTSKEEEEGRPRGIPSVEAAEVATKEEAANVPTTDEGSIEQYELMDESPGLGSSIIRVTPGPGLGNERGWTDGGGKSR